MGDREPQTSGGLTVRVRIRGRDQRPEQQKQWSQEPQETPEAQADEVQAVSAKTATTPAAVAEVSEVSEAPEISEDPVTVADEMYGDVSTPAVEVPEPSPPPRAHPQRAPVDWSDVPEPDPGADTAYVPRPVPRIMAVANQKGGVGQDDHRRQPRGRPGRDRVPGAGHRPRSPGKRHHRPGDRRPVLRAVDVRRASCATPSSRTPSSPPA